MTIAAGTRPGRYVIQSALGAGGMGEVYRATDTRLGRDVAIKVLAADVAADPARLERFEREAQSIAALSHANILAIFDVGTGDEPYLVTELLDGETLRARIRRCLEKQPGDRFQSAADLLAALSAAAAPTPAGPAAQAAASIAVLPFTDMSPARDQAYFCDGMAEEILTALARVEGLRVAPRTSTFHARATMVDLGQIAKT